MLADTHVPASRSDDGLPVLYDVGDAVAHDVVCSTCGYGVSVRAVLPSCPMCGGRVWEQARAQAPAVAGGDRASYPD